MANGEWRIARTSEIRDFLLPRSYSPFAIPLFTRLLVARQDVTGAFPGREEMIDHVEAPLAPRPIDCGDIDDAAELTAIVVAQESRDVHDVARSCRDGELAVRDSVAGDRARQRAGDGLAEFLESFVHGAKSISARSCRRGGSCSAAAGRRRAAPRRWAGSPGRRCRPARSDHSRARPSRNSGNSRRRWRTI